MKLLCIINLGTVRDDRFNTGCHSSLYKFFNWQTKAPQDIGKTCTANFSHPKIGLQSPIGIECEFIKWSNTSEHR